MKNITERIRAISPGKFLERFWSVFLILIMVVGGLQNIRILPVQAGTAASPAQQAATTNTLSLSVVSARTEPAFKNNTGVVKGDPITQYQYIINIDNTGTTDQRQDPANGNLPLDCTPAGPNYPGSCDWISIAGAATSSPIFTQGDQSDFAGINRVTFPSTCTDATPCRYLISVLADGFKLDGAHFTVPLPVPGLVTVEMQPTPLPDATIQAEVFEDISPTNGAPDVPAEHGMAGFQGHIADYLGEVTTDVYGDPLCGDGVCLSQCYVVSAGEDVGTVDPIDADGRCPLDTTGLTVTREGDPIPADSAIEGKLKIPNVGPNRYALSIIPPDGTTWIQTTTLEGNHDWDAWVMEGATGLDTEFVVAGEPFPAIIFGYVKPSTPALGGSGLITGVVAAFKAYVPAKGGVISYEPMIGAKIDKPIEKPWLALTDLTNGDTAIWIGQGDVNGKFTIPNVPEGDYTLTWWDEPQDYILNLQNVTVANGEVVNLGVLPLNGWWTYLDGFVFNDLNRNGVMDWTDSNNNGCPDIGEGELGIANFTLTMRKRENSLMDRGATVVVTDGCGRYTMENAYPITQWLVEEAYNDLYYTTGVTYQADNQPAPTTVLGAGVDVSVLPIIGLSGKLDWGVHAYDPTGRTNGLDPRNGGIVGTVSYDTTRNELDPRYAFVEDWQPGVPNLTVNLYQPVDCGTTSAPCDPTGRYELASDGSYAKGKLLNAYLTETWERPTGCVARDAEGNPLINGADENVLPVGSDTPGNEAECLEGPLMGVQYQTGYSSVDGNYGFGDGCFNGTLDASDPSNPACRDGAGDPMDFTPLPGGKDYLVEVEIPTEGPNGAHPGRPLYKVTREEDINIGNGDEFVPAVPPPACAGPLHTVDVAHFGTDNFLAVTLPNGIQVPASIPTENATFVDIGASPYEGQQTPLCDTKLVPLNNGKSIVPTFNLFTDVPIPGRFWGLIVDDLNFSTDPRSLLFGEKAGVPFAPVGIYDYANRLIDTVESDFNGLFDVLLPSSNRISCPTPSGVCANLYRFVGNDPGVPGALNPNFKPQFRTIAAEFEAFPGLIVPADLAPTQVGVSIELPGGQINQVACLLAATTPQLFAVSQPYVNGSGSFIINGLGFGAPQGTGEVTLDGVQLPVTSWSDTQIAASVPDGTPFGPHQLMITANNGQSTINGLTFHVFGSSAGQFPSTPVLDDFNRFNGLGNNWTADNSFALNLLSVRVSGTGTMRWRGTDGGGPVYGPNQEAYFTFYNVSNAATEQGLFLKVTGNGNNPNPTSNSSAYIEVSYKGSNPTSVQVRTKEAGTNTVRLQATFPTSFSFNDVLGARTLADGTVIAYKNGVVLGSINVTTTPNPWPTADAAGGGRLGIRFVGAGNTLSAAGRFDNFGGGNLVATGGYQPNLYEVGPGKPYATIQAAIDAAAASNGDDLVVVYPGQPDLTNPRNNPRGAYYENLIITTPIKLQGVGPGGFQGTTFVPGSIIDGSAFAGDTVLADAWRAKIDTLYVTDPVTGELVPGWIGNQNVSEGEVIYLLANSDTQYGADYMAALDGLDIRGGDQQGQATTLTQGGAIFANAYIRNLQVTNNVIEGNSASYGTIRIGTPDLPAPNTSQHNENLHLAYNRIIANAGTNLAGGIGLFAGADNYRVDHNDICGNFSAEYGGGLSVFGYSPNGNIDHNRIYYNASYDEGGGILIAGTLPVDPNALSAGSGPVDIHENIIQANLANDDGGGLRFLMAGNYPMNVYNNMIVNNVSTHEGGGISLNDAPDVRIYNNTVMKNLTTATAVSSLGYRAPAGLSTSLNSVQLQANLSGGSPLFSDPLLFNNIFWDNRAGSRVGGTVIGLGLPNDTTPIDNWDMGVADSISSSLAPTNSVLQTTEGISSSPTNIFADPNVFNPYNTIVSFDAWRTNPNFVGAILVAADLPPNLLGNYHIPAGSPAENLGAANQATTDAPSIDIDDQGRPSGAAWDSGADEVDGFAIQATHPTRVYLPLVNQP